MTIAYYLLILVCYCKVSCGNTTHNVSFKLNIIFNLFLKVFKSIEEIRYECSAIRQKLHGESIIICCVLAPTC